MSKHRHRKVENKVCDIKGCNEQGTRSVPLKKAEQYIPAGVKEGTGRRVQLCKTHYKEFKKASKTDRLHDRLAWQ